CPAPASVAAGYLPIGLAHGVRLARDVAEGAVLTEADVVLDAGNAAVAARREMLARA
ncbi:MAG: hypothetical protein JNG88_19705, partial [Phycisphaerales bacterium]|nr:hypothetical protein [Phycisphaerales bacterium]